jgi:hypothetical protein
MMANNKKVANKKVKVAKENFPAAVDLRSPEAIAEWEENEKAMQADKELHDRKRVDDRKRQQLAYSGFANTVLKRKNYN